MKKNIFLFILSIITAFSLTAVAQYDNPNVDHIPYGLINYYNPRLFIPMGVITIGDYDNFDMGVDYSEGHVSINPQNPLWIFNAWNINGSHYTLNGYDWNNAYASFPNAAGDPVTAYDSLGNLYYQTMKSPITGTWIAKSTNNGQSWVFTNVSGVNGNDKNWMACDQTNGPYANYVYNTMTPGNFARSTDFGQTFTQTATFSTQTLPGMMVAVGPNGNISGGVVYVVTHSGTNSAGIYTFYKSTNGGLNFVQTSQLQVANYIGTEISGRSTVSGMRTRPYPMIAADNSWGPYRGRLYLVWASNDPPGNGNKSDIFLKYSTDQGSTWSVTKRVNDDVNPQNNFSFFPAIWCDINTGKLYIKFYDTRNCPTSDSMDVYATYSTDGGNTFAPNQRLTNAKFKIKLSSSGSPPAYQGDYDAINSNKKVAFAIWADFRNNNYGSYGAYFPDFGMRLVPTSDTLNGLSGSKTFMMQVPTVKLYTDTVIITTAITPTPPSGTINVTLPSGNKLTTYPGSLPITVSATGGVTAGTYLLTVTAKGPNGTPVHKRTSSLVISPAAGIVENNLPYKYELLQNYPNPFNPTTRIEFYMAKAGNAKITVFDVLGKEITSQYLVNLAPGKNFIMFNAGNLTAGIYFYKFEAEGFTDVKKMMLVK